MTNAEAVVGVLSRLSCQTAERIAGMAMQMYQYKMTPAQVSGVMRAMVSRGQAASSKDQNNKTVYWLTEEKKYDSLQ